MRVILLFDLPEESDEYKLHTKAPDYHRALSDMSEYLRRQIKYQDMPPEKRDVFEEIRDKFVEILCDFGLQDDIP